MPEKNVSDVKNDVQNVFVIGLDDANLPTLEAAAAARSLRYHRLLTIEELQGGEVSVPELIDKARAVLDAFDGSIDAIVGYWDFPVSTLVPILAEHYGTRSTGLESIVKCEHKYWSRLEQQKVTDRHPRFGRVDLDTDDPRPPENVRFPMWVKPALSYSSNSPSASRTWTSSGTPSGRSARGSPGSAGPSRTSSAGSSCRQRWRASAPRSASPRRR